MKSQLAGTNAQSLSRSGVGPRTCILNKFLSDDDSAAQGPHFENFSSTI